MQTNNPLVSITLVVVNAYIDKFDIFNVSVQKIKFWQYFKDINCTSLRGVI